MNTKFRVSFIVGITVIFLSLSLAPRLILAIQTIGQFTPIEILVPHAQTEPGVKNIWQDLPVVGTFTDPDGKKITVNGFYHSKDLFMVRIAPDIAGIWKYSLAIESPVIPAQVINDSFLCVASGEQGFIRLHPDNPKRWIYSATGNLYTAVGFGDCMGVQRVSILGDADLIDGGYRPTGFHEGIGWIMPYSQYLTAYGVAAGFNIYRYSDNNCAYSIIKNISPSGNDYDTLHSRWTDTLFYALRSHGFRIYMTIFTGPQGNSSNNSSMAATLRYVQYCIDRYGSLVDFWELTNESDPDSLWIATVANYFHAHDPYKHLVSMSNEKASHPSVDIISPHWYGKEDVRNSDQSVESNLSSYRQYPKPVIFGEQGEVGWDSLSGIRLRGRIWSALFNEAVLVFWNSSFAKDCPCNQYLGWEERRYAKILQNFSALLDSGVRRIAPQTSGHLRIWGLQSKSTIAFYIRDFQDVKEINSGKQIVFNCPVYGTGYWYDVHTGDILGTAEVGIDTERLNIPQFQTDIAFVARFIPVPPITDSLFRIDVNPRTEVLLNNRVGTPGSFSVSVSNTGTAPVTMLQWFVSSPSSKLTLSLSTPFPFVLNPSETKILPVQYTMTDTGGTGAMLSFEHTASPAWENVAISATALKSSSVEENPNADENIKIYPDPANDVIKVEWQRYQSGKQASIQLLTLDGKIVVETTSDIGMCTFDVSKLPSGAYFVVLDQGKQKLAKKIVITH